MGQSAQVKMKNKKRTNITATQEGNKEKQSSGQCVNLKIPKSESECRAVEVVNIDTSQKVNSSKTKIVLKPEDIGIANTENLILKQGVKREDLLQEKFGMQQLSVLATMGDVEKTRVLFDNDDQRDPNERVQCDGSTPLILAVDNKHVEIVKLLLEHGADCTLTNNEGNNALMTAIKGGDADVINAIWPYKAAIDLNHANKHGYTALHYAVEKKWECCVQFLLANGASPDYPTKAGETPLMIAARLGDRKTAERLIQAKADILISDKNDLTAICKAMEHSKTEVLTYLLDKLSDDDAEEYLRAKLYYIKHPMEQSTFEDMYSFRLLMRLTRKPSLRDVFYSQKVISVVLDRMKEARQWPTDMLQLAALLSSIMFMFNKQPDVKLIKQYIYAGGPDFSTDIVKYYLGKMNVAASEAIISYLPIIGITEAPEGNAWLRKNAMRLLEFSSYFHAMCEWKLSSLLYSIHDKLIDLDPDFSKVLTPVWKSFHSTIFEIQKKQREKTVKELIQEEEREKERKVKREKKNQKRKTEKERKITKPEDSNDTQEASPRVQPDIRPSAERDSTKAINLSQNSNDNENDSAARPDTKSRKKQKNKRIHDVSNDVNDTPPESSEPNNDFIENQMINFSTSPGSWTMVQPKKHSNKEKEKLKDKQELPDTKPEDVSNLKKIVNKTPRKVLDKRRYHRDRFNGQTSCWADVAKGGSVAKQLNQASVEDEKVSGFSYEDDFPTLVGNNKQTGINIATAQTNTISQTRNSDNSPEEYRKDSSTYNSDGSGNPSGNSGLSFNSFCEIDTCGADEKYYSDEEVLACPLQPISEDVTYAGWEELADLDFGKCTEEANKTGLCSVKQIDSDTLQYLMDAYIASSGNSEPIEKFDSAASSQNFQNASQGSTEKLEQPLSPECSTKNCARKEENPTDGLLYSKYQKAKGSLEFKDTENTFWHEETNTVENANYIFDGTKQDIQITQTAYARDPSPTKSPRKRFISHKRDDNVLKNRHGRSAASRKEPLQDDTQKFPLTDKPELRTSQRLPVQFLDQAVSQHPEEYDKDETEQISFGWDEEQTEELPAWYTEPAPQNDGLNEMNPPIQNAYNECQFYAEEMYRTHYTATVASVSERVQKLSSIPNDDIANDPCVVQYWTQPSAPNVGQRPPSQPQGQRFGTVIPNRDFKPQINGGCSTQVNNNKNPQERKINNVQGNTKNEINVDNGNKITKKTAVVKPINPQWQHARHSVNCALGQSILENACRIDTTPDEVLYPSDLRDTPEPVEPEYFPSFHEDTRLSADYHPDAISVFHKMQQLQLIQLKNYYDAFQKHLEEKVSVYHNNFHYYASCIGLTEQQLNDYLGISQQQRNSAEHMPYQSHYQAAEDTECANFMGSPGNNRTGEMKDGDTGLKYSGQRDLGERTDEHLNLNSRSGKETTLRPTGAPVQPVQSFQMSRKYMENQEPSPNTVDGHMTADELKVLAARGVADQVLEDIKAAYRAMVAHDIKSRRWRDKLLDIRHMPASDINMIGNIIFPKVNQVRYIMASRPDTVMLGFLLNGTPVAVRIVNWRSRHLIRDDLQHLVDLDVSKYFMSKYKAFSFLDGNYYIAMDLYEYTLDEYLYKLKTDGQDTPLCTNKLIWQFMRGLNSIHQQCLMVHGEIRPSNIVLDVSGNLKIAGYGLGRKITSQKDSSEFSGDENVWIAPEILLQEQSDSFKADIWSAGMIMYFILSGGKQAPGTDSRDIVWNLSRRHLRMENISEEAYQLLAIMLSLNKAERPATSEALRHPYFWAEEKRLRFVLIAGSDVLRDLKMGIPMTGGPGDSMIDILNSVQSSILCNWMNEIDPAVLKEMRTFRQYKNSVVELVLFVYNCCLHFEKMSAKAREIIDEPCKYFLTRFPTLFMTVYGAIKVSNRTEKTCYKPFF